MKALEKDRSRRYETANGFAMDVERYLADEAVLACPPSAGYRFRKFARRNKAVLGVTALVLFFLLLIGSGVGWVLRDRAAQDAKLAGDRAARQARLNLEVEHALDDVKRARDQALALTDNPVRWKAALAETWLRSIGRGDRSTLPRSPDVHSCLPSSGRLCSTK
jgi:hypothetical protein